MDLKKSVFYDTIFLSKKIDRIKHNHGGGREMREVLITIAGIGSIAGLIMNVCYMDKITIPTVIWNVVAVCLWLSIIEFE